MLNVNDLSFNFILFHLLALPIIFHIARHTFAVMCLSKGAKIENVAKMMGHTDIKTTQIYAKVLNSAVEKEFDMLERIISGK